MKAYTNLKTLMVDNLRLLHNAEEQQIEMLPKIAEQTINIQLKKILLQECESKRKQLNRLNEAFFLLNESPRGRDCKTTGTLINRAFEILNNSADQEVSDAGILSVVQQLNHNEISAYGSGCSHAKTIGYDEIAGILHKSLEEERATDERLSTLAKRTVNLRAMDPLLLH